MASKYLYIVQNKNGVVVSDVAFSHSEAREMKNLYENLYQEKQTIVRFSRDRSIR